MSKIDLIIDALSRSVPVVWTRKDETERHAQALAYVRELQEQKPIAYIDHVSGKPKFIDGYVVQTEYDIPLYTAPPPRKEWVELNWDDIPDIFVGDISFCQGVKWAQAKLKEKNT